jgi:hypothetical protein
MSFSCDAREEKPYRTLLAAPHKKGDFSHYSVTRREMNSPPASEIAMAPLGVRDDGSA